MGKNIPGLKRGFHYDPVTEGLGIYVDGVQVADYTAKVGRTYYVNNITGSATGSGKSWGDAIDQVETAIAASETYRQLGGFAPTVSTNDYVRNTIVVQGTGTAYTNTTSIPNYCNIIGLGADPRGNGAGIASVDGASTDSAMAIGGAGVRGLGMYNMQLTQSGTGNVYGFDIAKIYRSRFENCAFLNSGYGGMRIVTGGSVMINDCHFGMDTYAQAYGLKVTGGANFNACLITNSDFHGETAGVLIDNDGCKQTILKDCMAFGGDFGFQDTVTGDLGYMPFYVRCYGYGFDSSSRNSAGFKLTNIFTVRTMDCIENANGTVYNIPASPS